MLPVGKAKGYLQREGTWGICNCGKHVQDIHACMQ